MTKLKRTAIQILSLTGAATMMLGVCLGNFETKPQSATATDQISKFNAELNTHREDFYDPEVVQKLPDTVEKDEDISIIVALNSGSVMDAYKKADTRLSLSDYAFSDEARRVSINAQAEQRKLMRKLDGAKISYRVGSSYDTVVNGFEITTRADNFEKINKLLSKDASLIVGEEYKPAETEIVTNEVDVYETGIFDSSSVAYQGKGVVVAVLDTGLDYTHTAFSTDRFDVPEGEEAFAFDTVAQRVGSTTAASFSAGLTGEDVYVSRKVPFAYDYADKDPDVLPINSDHGTHVAGIIAGEDDTITGVAPDAQLAIMKVFSDTRSGAKSSWIIAALEDCVKLGVDVINMSLGSSCGFSREVDEERLNVIYDSINEAGITLICAASNDYNATFGSDKNGTNPLTSNPDSGTVGSPSTYPGALSVASVDGVKTPYLLYGNEIIYFNEASVSSAKKKSFVDDILKTVGEGVASHDFEYVTIPGIGRPSDYPEDRSYYAGKIVLVKRGTNTFEEKVRVALKDMGAAGIIIYNNISGTISMSVGADVGAVCSIAQDEGEMLAAAGTGILRISREQVAGPFMSDFSSWGPTSDLKIKPEITAHGGEILSAIPGQAYDRFSGTSMAAPNQAGAAALIRQYVHYSGVFGSFPEVLTAKEAREVNALVNQLMMSTADIVKNKNGLPYAVRKQGAGLVNIGKASTTEAYIRTYDENGAMDKTKLELGDDKNKTGVYEMTFDIVNAGSKALTYDLSAVVMTEGVSKTYTSHSDTTSTQDGRLLSGAAVTVTKGGSGGNKVTVAAKSSQSVTVKIVLSEEDKQYMNESFKYGMYVEGFILLKGADAATTIDMNVPLLAFYGDWTEAPIFDEEYYDTHKDEINTGLDDEDKLMPDAYATRVYGGLYTDYIATLGAFPFTQNPRGTQIAANKEHIAISNYEAGENSAITKINSINAGLLRNAKSVHMTIVEDATGRVVFDHTEYNQRKSFTSGSNVYASTIDVEFATLANKLKNNTRYTVTATAYIDYGKNEDQKNVRNVFEFPLYIDFEAPVVTGVDYYTEYDDTTKKTKLFADLNIYDNHYAMGVHLGQVVLENPTEEWDTTFGMKSFGKYVTPVHSSFNSTSKVTIELTDYISQIRQSAGIKYNADGSSEVVRNNNSFVAVCYDYALNSATYEIRLPDEILAMSFGDERIEMNPNETKEVSEVLSVFPDTSWLQVLDFSSDDPDVATVVNNTIIAKKSGETKITATGYTKEGKKTAASVTVYVRKEGDEGYYGGNTLSAVSKFILTGYKTNKAYYGLSSSDREIGETGYTYDFGNAYELSMFPSESVTLNYSLASFYPEDTTVTYRTDDETIAEVSEDGTIVAKAEGDTTVTLTVNYKDEPTLYSVHVDIKVKDPYDIAAIYLNSYKGLGGEVIIPDDRGITTINQYAFSNYEYVDKDLSAGDVIDKEDPFYIKPMYIGENTITKVVIPEGVETIESYAFAKLTALEEVVFPSTLKKIGVGAFLGCEKLKTLTGIEHVKFINEKAFSGCAVERVNLASAVAIGNYAFENCRLTGLELPASAQSLGVGAFTKNPNLTNVTFNAPKIKIGTEAFAECGQLRAVDINAAVVAANAFKGCGELSNVTLGRDVAVIGEFAFAGTKVSAFKLDSRNQSLRLAAGGAQIYKGDELVLVAPASSGTLVIEATSVAAGAFAGNDAIYSVSAPNATSVGAYAFADCRNLERVELPKAEHIGEYAFRNTSITRTPDLSQIKNISAHAFEGTKITEASIPDNAVIGAYAFAECTRLRTVTIGDNVTVGDNAFYCSIDLHTVFDDGSNVGYYSNQYNYEVKDEAGRVVKTYTYCSYNLRGSATSRLTSLTVGANAKIGANAFGNSTELTALSIGAGARIGDYAFYNALSLSEVDLSGAVSIGAYAFSGSEMQDIALDNNRWVLAYERAFIGGREVNLGYRYTQFSSAVATVDLSGIAATTDSEKPSLGAHAFEGNKALNALVLGANMTEIADYAFNGCSSLSAVTIPSSVKKIGAHAFAQTALAQLGLSEVESIGDYAFTGTPVTKATLRNNVTLGDGVFAECRGLVLAENLKNVQKIGARAFFKTALTQADLTSAVTVGDFAFGESAVTAVTLGENIESLGENPFYGCEIASFGKVEKVEFDGITVGETLVETYDINETVKIIGGAIYQRLGTGLEFVSYPMAKAQDNVTVEEGTVRVSARAFFGASLQNVTLPATLKTLGDKAFYACGNLSVVVFRSFEAPLLEEEYDASYLSDETIPFSHNGISGLDLSQYFIWNIGSHYNNFYYGANFVDYVGQVDRTLVMVKPVNGVNYDTFITDRYFSAKTEGNPTATQSTLAVIAQIAALPEYIKLEHESLVVAAREAFNLLSDQERSLVTNKEKLENAEFTLELLKGEKPPEIDDPEKPEKNVNVVGLTVGLCCAIVVCAAAAAVVVFFLTKKKYAAAGTAAQDNAEEQPAAQATEEKIDKEEENE